MFYLSDNEDDMNTQDVWYLINAPTENEQKKLLKEELTIHKQKRKK